MIQTIIDLNLYSIDELSGNAKQKAIEDHRTFLLYDMRPEDFISGDPTYDTPDELEKAYNSEYEYYSMNDEPIIDSIQANDYLFFIDGSMANVTYHIDKAHNVTKRVLKLFNRNYEF